MAVPFGSPVRIFPYRKPPGCLPRLLAWLAARLRLAVVVGLIFGAGYACRWLTGG